MHHDVYAPDDRIVTSVYDNSFVSPRRIVEYLLGDSEG